MTEAAVSDQRAPDLTTRPGRLRKAHARYYDRTGVLLSNAEIGRRVGAVVLGKGKRISGQAVGAWFEGTVELSVERWEALAEILDIEPGWLVFGRGPIDRAPEPSEASPPSSPPLSSDEAQRRLIATAATVQSQNEIEKNQKRRGRA